MKFDSAGAGAGFTSSAKAASEEQRRAAARAIREIAGCALSIGFPLDRLNLMRHMPLLWRSGFCRRVQTSTDLAITANNQLSGFFDLSVELFSLFRSYRISARVKGEK